MVTSGERVSIMAHVTWTLSNTVAALVSLQLKCINLSDPCTHLILFDFFFILFGFVVWCGVFFSFNC